jgi:hypothetical protein
MASLECLSYCDYSLAIKAGVHFTLCGGTICKLGTAKHHEAFLPGIDTLALPGCFGMTELGHGSNVMGIETTVGAERGGSRRSSSRAGGGSSAAGGRGGVVEVVMTILFGKGMVDCAPHLPFLPAHKLHSAF